jgi:hypothetical protein
MVRRPGPRVAGLWVHELITQRPYALGSMAQILNTETVSWVLIYTVDRDVDGQERTGTRKNRLVAMGCRTRWPPLLRLVRSSTQGGAAFRWAIHDEFGSYVTRAMWRTHFAYLDTMPRDFLELFY